MMTQEQPMFREAVLMAFVGASLAIVSIIHLLGPGDGSQPFRADGAGIAEAIICVVLLGGVAILVADPIRGRVAALWATAFAVFGFLIGLSFTLRSGSPGDVIYHVAILPVLIVTLVQLLRRESVRAP
jgi:hypothetical protein